MLRNVRKTAGIFLMCVFYNNYNKKEITRRLELLRVKNSILFTRCKIEFISSHRRVNGDYFMVGERVRFLFTSCGESQTNERVFEREEKINLLYKCNNKLMNGHNKSSRGNYPLCRNAVLALFMIFAFE